MLRLFICKNCKFYFPAMGDNEINCPKCKNLSIPTCPFVPLQSPCLNVPSPFPYQLDP